MFVAIQVYAIIAYLTTIVDAKLLKRLFTTLALGFVAAVAFALISLQVCSSGSDADTDADNNADTEVDVDFESLIVIVHHRWSIAD